MVVKVLSFVSLCLPYN